MQVDNAQELRLVQRESQSFERNRGDFEERQEVSLSML